MEILDIKEFEDLLSLQAERSRLFEETAPPPAPSPLKRFTELKKQEEFKKEVESKLNPEDLPPKYFFSALGEVILNDD